MTVTELIARLELAPGEAEVVVVMKRRSRPIDPEFTGSRGARFEIDCDPPVTDEEEAE